MFPQSHHGQTPPIATAPAGDRFLPPLLLALALAFPGLCAAEPLPVTERSPELLRNLISSGRVYSLAIVTGRDTPAYPGRSYDITVFKATGDAPHLGENRLTGLDDRVTLSNGVGTQIDGRAHIGIDGIHYGGVAEADIFDPRGVRLYSTAAIEPLVTRGALLDIAAARGVAVLPPDYAITAADIEAALARQELSVGPGDVVLLHTGWLAEAGDDSERYLASSPGLGRSAARLLASLEVAAVGADNWGVEVVPAENPEEAFPVHQVLLAENGIYLLENLYTAAMARDGVDDFLFVLGVPRLDGAVQAVINPVAID